VYGARVSRRWSRDKTKARATRAGLLSFRDVARRHLGARAGAVGVATVSLAAGLLASADARADGPLGPNGTPITTSQYTIDLFQGPTLASARVSGMGGAYSALAEGAEGIPFNAASASLRFPYSTTRTDYDITAGITFPSSVSNTDFDNNGKVGFGYSNFVFLTGGLLLQHGPFGIGAVISGQNYQLGTPADRVERTSLTQASLQVIKLDWVASYAFLDDQLHLGGGVRGAFITASVPGSAPIIGDLLFGNFGVGGQGGVLWTPRHLPLRLGATIRSPVIGTIGFSSSVEADARGDTRLGGLYLPSGVNLPWEAEWGVAVQVGPRPLNIHWTDEDTLVGAEVEDGRRFYTDSNVREPAYRSARRILHDRYRAIRRRKLLLSVSMLATGPTGGAVGVESMLTQIVDRSGRTASFTMRGGLEAEVLPNRLQLRAGSYVEPTRFAGSQARVHGTGGFEVNVLEWDVFGLFPDSSWRISGSIDAARQYFGWGLGVGVWR